MRRFVANANKPAAKMTLSTVIFSGSHSPSARTAATGVSGWKDKALLEDTVVFMFHSKKSGRKVFPGLICRSLAQSG